MKKSISKYSFKIISIALLMSFLYTNLSLSEILITNCRPDNASCCCKVSDSKIVFKTIIEKKCCCEVKEMTDRPAENILFVTDTGLKNFSVNTVYSNAVIFNDQPGKITAILKKISEQSPPDKDILILNSNFRI